MAWAWAWAAAGLSFAPGARGTGLRLFRSGLCVPRRAPSSPRVSMATAGGGGGRGSGGRDGDGDGAARLPPASSLRPTRARGAAGRRRRTCGRKKKRWLDTDAASTGAPRSGGRGPFKTEVSARRVGRGAGAGRAGGRNHSAPHGGGSRYLNNLPDAPLFFSTLAVWGFKSVGLFILLALGVLFEVSGPRQPGPLGRYVGGFPLPVSRFGFSQFETVH